MDTIKNIKNRSPYYFAVSQLDELIGNIECCAEKLAMAAKRAKTTVEEFKKLTYERESDTC